MVSATRHSNLAAELKAKNHTVISGVAEKLGGKNEGLDPHELLEAALAACTVITVQMYANRKGWELESTDVSVHIDSEKETTHITREVSFRGELTDEQRARLLEIADKCPIHRLMSRPIEIETRTPETVEA